MVSISAATTMPAARLAPRRHVPLLLAGLGPVPLSVITGLAMAGALASASQARYGGETIFAIAIGLGVLAAVHRSLAVRLGAMGRGRRAVTAAPIIVGTVVALGWLAFLIAWLVTALHATRSADRAAIPFVELALLYVLAHAALSLFCLARRDA